MSEFSRRDFVGLGMAAIGAATVGCKPTKAGVAIPGRIVGASASVGHMLRNANFAEPVSEEETDVVIIGGGIAGLGAARTLSRAGNDRHIVLELEPAVGGSASSGRNEISAYPWGAHYLPIPNPESSEVAKLLEELGVIVGRNDAGLPIYDETMLCADPHERLFLWGRWQDGLLPQIGITDDDRKQYDRFTTRMEKYRAAVGADGKTAFTIPLDLGSQDHEFTKLDAITMARWLDDEGYSSAPLRWLVDYSCRDDYGAGIEHVSAWAGVHYFASRRAAAANAPTDAVLTWPEGNGWLVAQLRNEIAGQIRADSLVWAVKSTDSGVTVDYIDTRSQKTHRIQARQAICAAPRFIAQRLIREMAPVKDVQYSPWMVAAVTLDRLPKSQGVPLAWDNVMKDSRSLGYVVATHQNLDPAPERTVLSHYWPLDEATPAKERELALQRSHADWCAMILDDLSRVHSEIQETVRQIDVWIWGHGMIRPTPGFIWGEVRRQMQEPLGNIVFAHSDMSGISIFEEAYTRGVHAAERVLTLIS